MKKLLILLISVLFLFSCEEEAVDVNIYKPTSLGKQGEVLIVMHKKLWKTQLGELVKKNLAPSIDYYPQTEYLFDLKHYSQSTFNRGSKRNKNIVEFQINDHPEIKSGVNYQNDIWALDQNIIKVTGKSQQDLAQVFMDNAQEIKNYLLKSEMTRLRLETNQNKNHLVEKELQNKHNLSITVPIDMEILINNESFAALERKRLRSKKGSSAGDIQQYIFIYHYPYTSDSTFTKRYQIAKRDSVLKKYVEGKIEGSYMTTTPDSLAPLFIKEILFKNNYAYEIRGQYSMVNDFRGGPFVSISMVDERNGRVITIEGNVFCPKFNKREFMMELESIISSLAFY